MEKKEISKRLQSSGLYLHNFNNAPCEEEVIEIVVELLDKAREEGYGSGWRAGLSNERCFEHGDFRNEKEELENDVKKYLEELSKLKE